MKVLEEAKFLLVLAMLSGFISCSKEEDDFDYKEHTVIVYMIANNDLYQNALDNLNEIESAWDEYYDGNVIVIIEPKSSEKKLFVIEIEEDHNPKNIASKTVHLYEDKSMTNPIDMKEMLSDIINKYPSKRYSLILWSHATGWLPSDKILTYPRKAVVPTKMRSFGDSNGSQMEIRDLANSIPSNVFDLIIFDACYMGGVEVAYEIKDKANYIIASPTEVLQQGFPYESIIPLFFTKGNDAISIGKSFFNYYNSLEGAYRSAAIGVIKTSQLQSLAQHTLTLINSSKKPDRIINNINKIQFYDRFQSHIFYDLKETMKMIGENSDHLSSFLKQFDETVIYSANTEWFLNDFEINKCSGVSCYIPIKEDASMTNYFSLKWCYDSGFDILVNAIYEKQNGY